MCVSARARACSFACACACEHAFVCARDLTEHKLQDDSSTFAGMAMVVEAFESSGCAVVLVKRLPPLEQAGLGGGGGDILLYRIQLVKK